MKRGRKINKSMRLYRGAIMSPVSRPVDTKNNHTFWIPKKEVWLFSFHSSKDGQMGGWMLKLDTHIKMREIELATKQKDK